MENSFYYGTRGSTFKRFINDLLKSAKITQEYIDRLLTDDCMALFESAFTSASVDEQNNYEFFEQLGDSSGGKFIVDYMYTRFPHLRSCEGVKVVARLKINYGSKQSFSAISDSLGFWPYITATAQDRVHRKKPLLEDVFEAFLGVMEMVINDREKLNVGYTYVYSFLKQIFDRKEISLKYEDLYDAKTRLKELFDDQRLSLGKLVYVHEAKEAKSFGNTPNNMSGANVILCTVSMVKNGISTVIGQGTAFLKNEAEKNAAKFGLVYLDRKGIRKEIPEIYRRLTEAKQNLPTVSVLEKCGGEINKLIPVKTAKERYSGTLLSIYCRKKEYDSVLECVRENADPNVQDSKGMFALDYLLSGKSDREQVHTILGALYKKDKTRVPKIHKDVYDERSKLFTLVWPKLDVIENSAPTV